MNTNLPKSLSSHQLLQMDDDWDLHAVVRSCSAANCLNPPTSPPGYGVSDPCFQISYQPTEELMEIYMPFISNWSAARKTAVAKTAFLPQPLFSEQSPPPIPGGAKPNSLKNSVRRCKKRMSLMKKQICRVDAENWVPMVGIGEIQLPTPFTIKPPAPPADGTICTSSPTMSAVSPPPLASIAADAALTSSPSLLQSLSSIGLGYAIAIALGFLVLFSTILLASYICWRSIALRRQQVANHDRGGSGENSIYLPRVIFVSEEDEIEARNVIVGLDQALINTYPKFVFSKRNEKFGNETICPICLCEYRELEVLRMLPDCRHVFHVMCVDAWLKLNASCPVCRNSPLPTPMSTPLNEVVPLSQYADGRRRR